jgi:hypothetical protein
MHVLKKIKNVIYLVHPRPFWKEKLWATVVTVRTLVQILMRWQIVLEN